jgi:glycopeptide antibiotics resistance protein
MTQTNTKTMLQEATYDYKDMFSESFKIDLSLCFFETGSHYVTLAGLQLMILLPSPPSTKMTDMYHHAWLETS